MQFCAIPEDDVTCLPERTETRLDYPMAKKTMKRKQQFDWKADFQETYNSELVRNFDTAALPVNLKNWKRNHTTAITTFLLITLRLMAWTFAKSGYFDFEK